MQVFTICILMFLSDVQKLRKAFKVQLWSSSHYHIHTNPRLVLVLTPLIIIILCFSFILFILSDTTISPTNVKIHTFLFWHLQRPPPTNKVETLVIALTDLSIPTNLVESSSPETDFDQITTHARSMFLPFRNNSSVFNKNTKVLAL